MIPFTQYDQFHRFTRHGTFNTDPKIEKIAIQLIQKNGVRFEVEHPKSGRTYLMACIDEPQHGSRTIAAQIVKDSINEAVKLLVMDAKRYFIEKKG